MYQANVKGYLENRDVTAEVTVGRRSAFAEKQNVVTPHPGPGKMDVLSPVRKIDHQGPQINQAFAKSLLGTGPGVDPL
jgi:hypothetical protein